MSQYSLIDKAVHRCMIPFLFACASLQVAQAHAACECCDDECSKDRLFFSGVIQIQPLSKLDLTITPFVLSPCGQKEKFPPIRIVDPDQEAPLAGHHHFHSPSGLPAIRGEYTVGINIVSALPNLPEIIFTTTEFVTELHKGKTKTKAIGGMSRQMLAPPGGLEVYEFQFTDTFEYKALR